MSPTRPARLYAPVPSSGRAELWERLRELHGAVAPVELDPGVPAWLLLGYHENLSVLQNPHLFSRDTRQWREVTDGRVDLAASRPALSWRPNALYADGPEHTRLRAPVADGLARLDLSATARTVRRMADDLIDAFAATGRADLIGDFAAPLPVLVLNHLYGLPDSYGHMLGDLTAVVFGADARRGEEAVARVHQYFAGLVSRKRGRPGADLVSWMMEHPSRLSDHELAHAAALIDNAGHQPTTHLIGNTLRTLLTDPRIRTAHADARLTVHDLLDHVMWTDTPFQVLPARIALQDVRIGTCDVRGGDALLIGFEAAHRDPAVRSAGGGRAHLMFGAGPHACPARNLARTIAATAVTAAHERLGGLRLDVAPRELRLTPSPFLRGLAELPVAFTPDAPVRPAAGPPEPRAEEHADLLSRLLSWWRRGA
ncbi:cytochrome P450 [Nocardiopsis aegyptia]|uniref:Cytochrome P450 n=1 Tax=Nocardiopsis aegyptia TaxID=220378 RepID=A0A7Z0JAB4_9ACTN|nr:cytochrome P450 [Nocardiopsis aegyptia]NYJ34951.1 cytochrome P450 [Nocardiopsis aegyptia]